MYPNPSCSDVISVQMLTPTVLLELFSIYDWRTDTFDCRVAICSNLNYLVVIINIRAESFLKRISGKIVSYFSKTTPKLFSYTNKNTNSPLVLLRGQFSTIYYAIVWAALCWTKCFLCCIKFCESTVYMSPLSGSKVIKTLALVQDSWITLNFQFL